MSKQIVDVLRRTPWLTARQICEQTGANRHSVSARLAEMRKAGVVRARPGPLRSFVWEAAQTPAS